MALGQARRRAKGHAVAAPGADTNFVTPITPARDAEALRITISLATASVLDVRITDGTDAYSIALNGGSALAASTFYTFDVQCGADCTYSLRVRTNGVIQDFRISEMVGA